MPASLYDAHAHLQDPRLASDLDAVWERARAAGVSEMGCAGTREEDWEGVDEVARRLPAVPGYGLHPWFAGEPRQGWLRRLGERLQAEPLAFVGEVGLDRLHGPPLERQLPVLRAQLGLARELRRPAVLHVVRAWGPALELLESLGPFPEGLLLHSFGGSAELVPRLARLGAFFSFSGRVCGRPGRRLREAARAVPSGRLLVETDAPDLPPRGHPLPPSGWNEPALLPAVVEALAALRGEDADELAARAARRARELLGEPQRRAG